MPAVLKSELEKNNDPQPLPPAPAPAAIPPVSEPETPEQKSHRLELENAELRGKTSVLEKEPPAQEPAPMPRPQRELQWEQTKILVNGHIGSMTEEDFETKYGVSKSIAQGQIVTGDQQISTEKTAERTTKMEAENKLYAKYGPEYAEVADEMSSIILEASPEVRNDPKRLASYIERQFKAIRKPKKEEPKAPVPVSGDPMQRRISNFDNSDPIPAPAANPNEPKKTPVDPSFSHILKQFKIDSEEERQKYMSENIRMDMGRSGGKSVILADEKKGFERV